ncbi:MAG: hypothetical protein MMC33_010062 [Icmadophila ericetorum]|nr:hypothetical protein [Icmadophila ericetorum]
MAFVSVTTNHSHDEIDNMIDIIGIPAIGADPKATWNIRGSHQWLGPALHEEIPSARVLLYDHLEEGERSVEVKPLGHVDHEASTVRTANARDKVARFGLEDWTTRFIEAVHEVRNTESVRRCPQKSREQIVTNTAHQHSFNGGHFFSSVIVQEELL